jgi:serpin B
MKPFVQEPQESSPSDIEALVRGNNEFAFALFQKIRTAKGNLFFSPYSVWIALAMTYAGARGNTAAQMAQAFRFPLDQKRLHPACGWLVAKLNDIGRPGVIQLKVANALFPHVGYPLLEAFLELTERYYGVLITPVDYGAAGTARGIINAWVEEKTERKIQELIPGSGAAPDPGILDNLTRLVLVNAIYFKGRWASQFDQDRTRAAPFWITSNEAVQAPMMTQSHEFRYAESDNLQILELPYTGDDLSMVVLLPRGRDGLASLEAALTVQDLGKWTRNLRDTEVQVSLPRFEITFPTRLDEALTSMGMVDAFSLDRANFAGMDGHENCLYVAAVFHKAFVAVNEEGTEAAAATAVVMKARAMPAPPPVFRADHPFVFFIRENSTGSILFLGRVANPI